jgi:hypothetical protein
MLRIIWHGLEEASDPETLARKQRRSSLPCSGQVDKWSAQRAGI